MPTAPDEVMIAMYVALWTTLWFPPLLWLHQSKLSQQIHSWLVYCGVISCLTYPDNYLV